ncbi:MAG: DUF4178 domain-containing protein [Planctomycetaceae bacterium]
MRGVQAACPACAGPVEFKISSALVTVCPYCRSVVARGDRKLEDHGKVAAIVDTASPLHLGLRGKFRGKRFDLVGRVQFQHSAGGVWDEWYAAFPGGKWGWLAESQGQFHLSFERKVSAETELPSLDELEVGRSFEFPKVGRLTIAEIGQTQALGAEGELPFQLEPHAKHSYADLSGSDGAFATFDYSTSPPTIYTGKQVTLDDLGLADVVHEREARQISAKHVNCPNCGGVLDLIAPDKAERVCCPHCSSLLDVDGGKLEYLKTLEQGQIHPVIPIGAVGVLDDVEYTVIGFVRRSVTFDMKYYWTEYLLYQPKVGFRWLIHSDQHWSFAEPLSLGDIRDRGTTVGHDERTFKLFQSAAAQVEYVLGEFYWKVEVGEEAYSRDFICPPQMITLERTKNYTEDEQGFLHETEGGELNATIATYLPHETVEEAFDVENLSRGWTPAPNQPNPVDSGVFAWWGVFGLVLLALFVIFRMGLVKKPVDGGIFFWALVFVSVIPIGALIYRYIFESSRWKDSEFNPYASSE